MQINIIEQNENLFPEIEWSRPQNKRQSGRLLLIGGNSEGFINVIRAYEIALSDEVTKVSLALPDRLMKMVPKSEDIKFLKSTPSGSISDDNNIEELVAEIDHILVPGDLTKNSQTQLFIEKLISFSVPVTFSNDSDYYLENIGLQGKNIVYDFNSLQKILIKSKNQVQISSDMGKVGIAQALLSINENEGINTVLEFDGSVFVCAEQKVSHTKIENLNMIELAVVCAINSMHFTDKPFQALTNAVWELKNN